MAVLLGQCCKNTLFAYQQGLLYPRLEITTPKSNKYLGYATITRPFHPWKGQSFQISSTRKSNDRDILNVKASTGDTIVIPRDWTDKADPDPYKTLTNLSPPVLSFSHLQELVKLIRSSCE